METFKWSFSHKNVPFPTNQDYKQRLISQTSKLIRNLTWKAMAFLKPEVMGQTKNNFRFKTTKMNKD